MNYQTVMTTIGKVFTAENLKKLEKVTEFIGEQGDKILEGMDAAADGIDRLSQWVKDNTDVLCEMYQLEKLDIAELKDIIAKTKTTETAFVALLNLGRNKKDELEIFVQHLDANKKAVNKDKVYCIRCEAISKELKENFEGQELLLINL